MNKESIKYSLNNLKHRKGRSFLTIFSILVGIATIFIFVSYGYGLYDYTESFKTGSSADKLMIVAKGVGMPGLDETFKLTDDDLDAILGSAGVYEASGSYYQFTKIERGSEEVNHFFTSYDPKFPLMLEIGQMGIEKGRLLRGGDRGVVVGYNYLIPGKIFKNGLDINDIVEVNGTKLKIIGFMEKIGNNQDDGNLYVTNERFLDIFPEKTYAQIIARADIDEIDKTSENIKRSLRKERNLKEGEEDFFVQTFEELIESFSGAINIIIAFIILIALISVLVSAVNTANTMITSVLERYKEIGVLKAIGARNSEVFGIFLFESSFLGFIAGSLGVLLGYVMSEVGAVVLDDLGFGFLQPFYSVYLFVGLVVFAILTGAVSGVIPALRAAKTNTVDALRHE